MANIRTLQRSFAGGEISPGMYGRVDDSKYQSGLATCKNFIATAQGPAENRPGTVYVNEVKTSAKETRLIPFTYSTTDTMVIEMGDQYFRFHTNGATLQYTVPAAWATPVAYIVGDLVAEAGTNYYCITAHTSGATFAGDAAKWYALPADLTFEIPTPYLEADLFEIHYVQSADVLTFTHTGYAPRELRRTDALATGTEWTLIIPSFGEPISAPTGGTATNTPETATDYTYSYVITTVAEDLVSESAPSVAATCQGNLFNTGEINTITWNPVTGAGLYNVYKLQGGLYGYIGQTRAGTETLIDDNIAPDLSYTPPIYDEVFDASDDYPAAVSYFEQRRCFAGTLNAPQNLWMTKSGTESTMSYRLPVRDDDRIAFRVAAREANTIRHIVPLSQLLILTSAAEWRVTSQNSDAITPTTVAVSPQSYVGASDVQPVIVNTNLIYGASRGGHIRELAYNWQASGFVTGDLSLRAAHLFDTLSIVDMAYSKAPQPIVWMVSSGGNLLGLTYIPEQQVGAWHKHTTTSGLFESCAVVAEGTEDVLYVVVKRTIDGSDVRYIERIASRFFTDPEDAIFVDSALSYDGTNTAATTVTVTTATDYTPGEDLTITTSVGVFTFPAQTDVDDAIILTATDGTEYTLRITSTSSSTVATAITDKTLPAGFQASATALWSFGRVNFSGLDHLEGETVNILADGAVHPQRVVTSGAISLDVPSVVVHVGLPIVADLETLPLTIQAESAFGQGRVKNVNKAALRVYRSSGIFIGPDSANLVEAKQRSTALYGSPPELKSEEIEVYLTPSWARDGQVFVRQLDPLPLTVSSLVLDVAIGG